MREGAVVSTCRPVVRPGERDEPNHLYIPYSVDHFRELKGVIYPIMVILALGLSTVPGQS